MNDKRLGPERWVRVLQEVLSAGLALYVGRVWADFGPATGRWAIAVLLAIIAFAATRALQARWHVPLLSLAIGWLYVLWPWTDPRVAGAVGFLAAVLLLIDFTRRLPQRVNPGLVVFFVSLAVYVVTLAPTVLPADAGEFQLVARTLGIAHPPGYPLYTLAGWLFTWLPLGDAAYRVNLLSAVTSAATLAVVTAAVRRLTGSTGAGIAAALGLGSATTFWAQATTANIRSMTALFTALCLMALLRYGCDRRRSDLILFAFAFGLAVGHHISLAILGLPAVVYVLLVSPRLLTDVRLLARMAGAFALALLVLLYLPLRGATGAPLNPGGLTTVSGFVRHVLALGFQGDMLYFADPAGLFDRLAVLVNILDLQFGTPLLLVAGLGLIVLAAWKPREGVLIGGTFAASAALAITYRAPQTVEYLMPAYVALAILLGAPWVLSNRRGDPEKIHAIAANQSWWDLALALVLLFGARNAWINAPSYRVLSQDTSARQVAAELLAAAPEGATILAGWHQVTPLWYLQVAEGMRPDVRISYVAPRGAEPIGVTWRQRVLESARVKPTIVTNRYPEFAELPFLMAPFHGAYQANGVLGYDLPPDASPVASEPVFEDQFRLRGFHSSDSRQGVRQVTLFWEPMAEPTQDFSTFVHVVDSAGRVWGQHDVAYSSGVWQPGQLLADAHSVAVLPETPPGRYRLIAGIYTRQPDGTIKRLATPAGDTVTLASVDVVPEHDMPVTQHPLFQPFAGGPTLVGVDYDTGRPESLRLYLHWLQESGTSFPLRVLAAGEAVAQGTVPGGPGYVTTALDLPADANNLSIEVAGQAPLGPFRLPWNQILPTRDGRATVRLPEAASGERWLNFGGDLVLTRADVLPARPGGQAIVNLEFTGLQPLTRDYTVSVQVPGWSAQADGTPALGAIPTLKWIRGTRVRDRHRLAVPVDVAGASPVMLTVYDAFTQEPLVVLDDRALKAGEGTRVKVGEAQIAGSP